MLSRLVGIGIFVFTNNFLQQYKNKIVVQLSSYHGHIFGCLGCGEAADHMITRESGSVYPFFFATYMVLFDTFLY